MLGGKIASLCLVLALAVLSVLPGSDAGCAAFDFKTGLSYDLSGLTKTRAGDNWKIATPQYTYLLNICKPLTDQTITVSSVPKKCNSTSHGCQIDTVYSDQRAKNLGSVHTLKVKDRGELELQILGGDHCRTVDTDRSVSILFHCNVKAGVGSPTFVQEDASCGYIFEWETSHACPVTTSTLPPVEPKDCMVVDSNTRYDLTPLSLSNGNWIVNEGEYQYLLNVCNEVHSVAACAGYGACQIKPEDSSFIKQLGLASARPYISNDVLKITMTGGRPCHGGSVQRQTTIIFTCLAGESLGTPVFLHETDSCEYVFSWETSAACGEPLTSQCSVQDPVNNKYVDLEPLIKKQGETNHVASTAVPGDTSSYKLNLCAGLVSEDNPCRDGTSICQIQRGQTSGRSLGNSGTLTVYNGDVVMKYSDGDLCEGTDERITTDIYFICDKNEKNSAPRLLTSKNNCQYLFNWRTIYACETDSPGDQTGRKKISAGAILAIVFSIVFAIFLGGIAFNRFVRGEKGTDQIPCSSLCQAAYYTVAEKFSRSNTGSIQI